MATLQKTYQKIDLPREKALRLGLHSLSNAELLCLLIGSGFHETSVLDLSNQLLKKCNGLLGIVDISSTELMEFKGIKKAKALNILAAVELHKRLDLIIGDKTENIDEEYLYNKYKYLQNADTEELILVILNSQKVIIFEDVLCKGTSISIHTQPTFLLKSVVRHNGKYFYLIHNHPSGNSSPSKSDLFFTNSLSLQSKALEVCLLDHIIIGREGYYSFKKMKKL